MAAVNTFSNESFWFMKVTWNVSEQYIDPNIVDDILESPVFSFAHATWQLHIAPFGLSSSNTVEWINLGIRRENSEIPEHDVFFKVYFKTRQGKEFEPCQGVCFFTTMYETYTMRYIRKDKFFKEKLTLMTNGIFTMVCEMQIRMQNKHVILGKENFSQTELSAPVIDLDSTQKLEPSIHLQNNKVFCDYRNLFMKQEGCDVLLKVKGAEFKAHKIILSARSPVFASAFRHDMEEKTTGVIDIQDCESSSFADFLSFLYCGYIQNLSSENVFSLFITADKYDVSDLRAECMEFMKKNLTVDTFCDTITLALQHCETELIKLATDFFAKNLQKIIVTVKWQTFVINNPVQGNELMIKALVPNASKHE